MILAVILAPTDAALGQAVVTEPRVPGRIRQGLNVESGLNDGICVPLLFAAVAAADVESHISEGRSAATLLLEEIGYGVVGGVAAGLLIGAVIVYAGRRDLIEGTWRQVIPAAGAALAYGTAVALDGSGFIAAFVAGMVFRAVIKRDPEDMNRLTEEVGGVLNGLTFVLFGAILLGPALGELSWELALYAVLSLTVVRIVPVAIGMLGSRARLPTLGFLGWFGPRGLASIVFAVIVIEESQLPHEHLIVLAIYLTVGLSVFAHGLTAAPLANRYARLVRAPPPRQGAADGERPGRGDPHPRVGAAGLLGSLVAQESARMRRTPAGDSTPPCLPGTGAGARRRLARPFTPIARRDHVGYGDLTSISSGTQTFTITYILTRLGVFVALLTSTLSPADPVVVVSSSSPYPAAIRAQTNSRERRRMERMSSHALHPFELAPCAS